MRVFMAIDQGTSSSRAILFDIQGQIVGSGQQEFDNEYPHDGWVEQDPELIWSTTLTAARNALADTGLTGRDVLAIGITNQRETTLLWDKQSHICVHPAIVWQDRRTAAQCELIRKDGMAARITQLTGLVVDPYFSATKMAWLLDQVPEARRRAESGALAFGTVDSFLIWRLTKGQRHVTDATNAARTQLFDLREQCWSRELLEYFRIPEQALPEVLDCAAEFGVTDPEWFGAAIPILGVAGDQQAALIGQACIEPEMAKCTYGTGCFAISHTGKEMRESSSALLSTVAYRLAGETHYALEGSVFVAGSAIKWLRDQLGLIASAEASEAAARRCGPDTQGVYIVPAFTGMGAPHWDPDARGLITGLTLDSGRDQIITATLESVVFQTAELLEAMARDRAPCKALRVDGGMVGNDWLCQFLADTLNMPVDRPLVTETTAQGAAMLAALGSGTVSSLRQAAGTWQLERRFEPGMPEAQRRKLRAGWDEAVRRARTSA